MATDPEFAKRHIRHRQAAHALREKMDAREAEEDAAVLEIRKKHAPGLEEAMAEVRASLAALDRQEPSVLEHLEKLVKGRKLIGDAGPPAPPA